MLGDQSKTTVSHKEQDSIDTQNLDPAAAIGAITLEPEDSSDSKVVKSQSENKDSLESNSDSPPKYKDYELQAMEQGWVPLTKYKGDIADYKGARAFLKDGEYINRHQAQLRKFDEMEKALNYLVEHNKNIEKLSHERAIEELKKQQASAAEIGDSKKVLDLTDKISSAVRTTFPSETPQQKYAREVREGELAFRARNPWYNVDQVENHEKINYAKMVSQNLLGLNPGLSISDHFLKVEEAVNLKFKGGEASTIGKFSRVESGEETHRGGSKKGFNDLPTFHKNVARQLSKTVKGFKLDEYIKQLEDLGEIK
jgi:hypothetical protein